jgi:hypothetical protein
MRTTANHRVQYERTLQEELLWRLKRYSVLPLVTPNGIHIPVRSDNERLMRARLINRMKAEGMLLPGAPDIVLLWAKGAALIETKRPAYRDLWGYHPAGTASQDQQEFARRADGLGIRHAYCSSWHALQKLLEEWGVAPQ